MCRHLQKNLQNLPYLHTIKNRSTAFKEEQTYDPAPYAHFCGGIPTRHVTHAAQNLHMTQPAVTRAVQELEQHYGVRLFERLYRHLSPTEAAQRLYAQAVYLLDTFDHMEAAMRDWDSLGVVRVGATVTLGSTILPVLARRFAALYPGIELQAKVANGSVLAEALCENQLDLALLENSVSVPDLHTEPIGTDCLCAVLAPAHPLAQQAALTLQQLVGGPLLLREPGSTAREVLEHACAEQGLALHPAWESVSTAALVQAAAQQLGVAILPEQLAAADARTGLVCTRPIRDAAMTRRHVVAWHKEKYLTASMRRFITLCRSAAEEVEKR